MTRTIVGVIRGGTSSEADLSLKTGTTLMNALPEDDYDVRDIFIDKSGDWYVRGRAVTPAQAFQGLDVALNGLHGGMGEDGTLARIAKRAGIPMTGSPAHACAATLNKARAREFLTAAGIRMPQAIVLRLADNTSVDTALMARHVFDSFAPPYILKPVSEGASEGIMLARTIIELADALAEALSRYDAILVEEYLRGQEATVGVLQNYREEMLYTLPPAEIGLPAGHAFLPKEALRGGLEVRVPAPSLSRDTKRELETIARFAHEALGLEHYSRADFIVTPRGPYLLEVNALPGLYEGAALPKMLDAVGESVPGLVRGMIDRELSVA